MPVGRADGVSWGSPGVVTIRLATSFSFDDLSPVRAAADVDVPTLHYQVRDDKMLDSSIVQTIYDAIRCPEKTGRFSGRAGGLDPGEVARLELDRGGHFAAFERPNEYLLGVRAALELGQTSSGSGGRSITRGPF